MKFLVAYLITAAVFLIIDYIWLGFVMKDYFQEQLGHLMREDVQLGIAALFYLFYAGGIVLFAVAPAMESGGWMKAAMLGAVLGFLAYGTYDVTNAATLKDWPVMMSVIDVAWGTTLTAVTAAVGYWGVTAIYGS
jgi:uncharacterized membrane protein